VTHHHPHHTGGLPLLLDTYPDARAVFYEDEQPFLQGGKPFLPPDSFAAKLYRWMGLLGKEEYKAGSRGAQASELQFSLTAELHWNVRCLARGIAGAPEP
jgi:glyoxylase-like metal-dependent hydrolase (beta-lactamase superfamily II)